MNRRIAGRKTATILAALRYWRREGLMSAGHEQDIATDNGHFPSLSAEEIDVLCEQIGSDNTDRLRCWVEGHAQAAIGNHHPRHLRALDDIDVREEENDEGVVVGGRIEWATFTEGEYVESILVERARATSIYNDLGKVLGITSHTTFETLSREGGESPVQ